MSRRIDLFGDASSFQMKIFCFCVQKRIRRSEHARKETDFLRLKRTRLGLEDFESLKVIGRGAFGEVRGGRSLFFHQGHKEANMVTQSPSVTFTVLELVDLFKLSNSDQTV